MDLHILWFILVAVLLAGYAVLDGFDLGVGILHLFTKDDLDRRIMLNSIGPVWDGNEVWLVTGGGALFAAFPDVYATVFSGFYTAFYLLLAMLIFRAVSIEFRSKEPMKWWRQAWDVAFSISSLLIALLMGVALGNIIIGVPVAADKEFAGSFLGLLNPFSLMIGVCTVALFAMHGSIYAVMKTEGELHERIKKWVKKTIIFFILCYGAVTMTTLIFIPHMIAPFKAYPVLFAIPVITLLAIANIPRAISKQQYFFAFISSSGAIVMFLALTAIGLFPNLVLASNNPAYSLTIYNASASQKTLEYMTIIAVFGVPVVLAYTFGIYWVFKGKVKLDSMSY